MDIFQNSLRLKEEEFEVELLAELTIDRSSCAKNSSDVSLVVSGVDVIFEMVFISSIYLLSSLYVIFAIVLKSDFSVELLL